MDDFPSRLPNPVTQSPHPLCAGKDRPRGSGTRSPSWPRSMVSPFKGSTSGPVGSRWSSRSRSRSDPLSRSLALRGPRTGAKSTSTSSSIAFIERFERDHAGLAHRGPHAPRDVKPFPPTPGHREGRAGLVDRIHAHRPGKTRAGDGIRLQHDVTATLGRIVDAQFRAPRPLGRLGRTLGHRVCSAASTGSEIGLAPWPARPAAGA